MTNIIVETIYIVMFVCIVVLLIGGFMSQRAAFDAARAAEWEALLARPNPFTEVP